LAACALTPVAASSNPPSSAVVVGTIVRRMFAEALVAWHQRLDDLVGKILDSSMGRLSFLSRREVVECGRSIA